MKDEDARPVAAVVAADIGAATVGVAAAAIVAVLVATVAVAEGRAKQGSCVLLDAERESRCRTPKNSLAQAVGNFLTLQAAQPGVAALASLTGNHSEKKTKKSH